MQQPAPHHAILSLPFDKGSDERGSGCMRHRIRHGLARVNINSAQHEQAVLVGKRMCPIIAARVKDYYRA